MRGCYDIPALIRMWFVTIITTEGNIITFVHSSTDVLLSYGQALGHVMLTNGGSDLAWHSFYII